MPLYLGGKIYYFFSVFISYGKIFTSYLTERKIFNLLFHFKFDQKKPALSGLLIVSINSEYYLISIILLISMNSPDSILKK